jgi:epoxide hydrolase 4
MVVISGALTPPINYYRSNIFATDNLKGLQQRPQNMPPGLLIFGEKDKFLNIAGVAQSEQLVPHLQTKIIRRGNHFVQQDEPEEVNEAMRDFLKSF